MKVSFPHTNPIVFSTQGAYHNYMDAYGHEERHCFIQPFCHGDRIVFHVLWSGADSSKFVSLKVDVVEDGTVHSLYSYSFRGDAVGGTYGKSFYRQTAVAGGRANGQYYFSSVVENIGGMAVNAVVHPGDVFFFRVTIGGVVYESNTLRYSVDIGGTKLLHYNSSNDYVFDAQVSDSGYGFDVRLPAFFLHPEPGAYKEVFEGYSRDLELVSATPFENIELEVGGNTGIPDWFVKNLNVIFHCDMKSIDGVMYELTVDSAIEPERVDGYNNCWLRIGMAGKENALSWTHGSNDAIDTDTERDDNVVVIGTDPGLIDHIDIDDDDLGGGGNGRPWFIDVIGGVFKPNKLSGVGVGKVIIHAGRNLGKEKRTGELLLKDFNTGKLIKRYVLVQEPWKIGISYGTVGDTLFVREKRIVN